MKNKHLIISTIACIGLAAVLSSPVQAYKQNSPLDQNFGRSYESVKFKQIINHEPADNKAIEGLDGQAAMNVMEQYRQSFSQKSEGESSQALDLGLIGME
jgi:hypothetical protein